MKANHTPAWCKGSDPRDGDPSFLIIPSHLAPDISCRDRISRFGTVPVPETPFDFQIGEIDFSVPFPELMSGTAFRENALRFLRKSKSFAVMMVRPDRRGKESAAVEGSWNNRIFLSLYSVLREASQDYVFLWGLSDPVTFCGIFQDMDASATRESIQSIRKRLEGFPDLRIHIGAALYPFHRFSREETLGNALKALEHALLSGPDADQFLDVISLNISGDRMYQNGDIAGAVAEFEHALHLEPQNANILNSLGVCFGVQRIFHKALRCFEAAMTVEPNEVMAVYNTGVIHLQAGDVETSRKWFLQAEPLGGDVFEVLLQAGKAHLDGGDPHQAVVCLEKALGIQPDSSHALRFLGQSRMETGDYRDAVGCFSRAVKRNPFDSESLSALGYLYEKTGESLEIAEVFCRKSVEISPRNGLNRFRLGVVYFRRHCLDEALAEFRIAGQLGVDVSGWLQRIVDIRMGRNPLESTREMIKGE
jgi:Flp pilus assembly protein TadD